MNCRSESLSWAPTSATDTPPPPAPSLPPTPRPPSLRLLSLFPFHSCPRPQSYSGLLDPHLPGWRWWDQTCLLRLALCRADPILHPVLTDSGGSRQKRPVDRHIGLPDRFRQPPVSGTVVRLPCFTLPLLSPSSSIREGALCVSFPRVWIFVGETCEQGLTRDPFVCVRLIDLEMDMGLAGVHGFKVERISVKPREWQR